MEQNNVYVKMFKLNELLTVGNFCLRGLYERVVAIDDTRQGIQRG